VLPDSPLLQSSYNGVCHFCSLKIDQVIHENA
jgi:hypothetical protein